MRGSLRAGVGSTTLNLDLNSPLPSHEAVVKKNPNKRGLSRLLSMFYLGCGVSVESRDDSVFLHDETDITIIRYLFHAADASSRVKFSATTAIFSCGWSTGRGVSIYRFVFLCKWRSGMVLSFISTPHVST